MDGGLFCKTLFYKKCKDIQYCDFIKLYSYVLYYLLYRSLQNVKKIYGLKQSLNQFHPYQWTHLLMENMKTLFCIFTVCFVG